MLNRSRIKTVAVTLLPGLLVLLIPVCAWGAEEPAPPPPVPRNLITNPDFEIDADRDGLPDGWFCSEPQYWCGPMADSPRWKELRELWVEKGAVPAVIPFRHPDTLEGGTYRWEASGRNGGHSISIDETTALKWGEWDTVVTGIKPKTDYVIMGWRKQSHRAGGKGAAPWMKIAAFGKLIPIVGAINRDAWVPFAVAVNSGDFKDKCSVGVIVESAPTKVWIDKLAMFKGALSDIPRFLVGPKGAALEYPFHSEVYASPDIQCPLFLDAVWLFPATNGGPKLEIVIDLPDGLDLTWGGRGMAVKLEPSDPERIAIEGRPYIRRAFTVLSAKDIRKFDSIGKRMVRLWLKTDPDLRPGVYEAFYHARWQGGRQPDQSLSVRVMRIDKVPQPKNLLVAMAGPSAELVNARANILVKDLARIGVNCLLLDDGLELKAAESFEKAGISPAAWFDLGAGAAKEGRAKDIRGLPAAGRVCPSYRPEDPIKTLFAGPAKLVKGGTTVLFTDLRNRRHACFCGRCVKEFEVFAKEHNPDLEVESPAKFEAEPEKHKELHAAWLEFHSTKRTELYWTLRKSLDDFRKTAGEPFPNASSPLRLLAIVPAPGQAGADARAAADYVRMAGVFDVAIIEPNMLSASTWRTPNHVGDETSRLIKLLPPGGRAGTVVDAGACDGRNAMGPVLRHSDVRGHALDAVMAGAKVLVLQPFYAVDGMDMKELSRAIGLLRPFEGIIAEGEAVDLLKAPEGGAAVRSLGKQGGPMLVLVTDHSAAPAAVVKLAINNQDGPKRQTMVLFDIEGAKIVSEVSPDAKDVSVPLNGSRARLFYLGPKKDLPVKSEPEK